MMQIVLNYLSFALVGVFTNKYRYVRIKDIFQFSYMADINFDYHPQFFTATILEWKHLLKEDEFKDIIIKSLQFLVKEKSVVIYAFVIMPNHIHLIWQIQDGFKRDKIQLRFLKFTAQQMKFKLLQTDKLQLEHFRVNTSDREYQFWERNALSID